MGGSNIEKFTILYDRLIRETGLFDPFKGEATCAGRRKLQHCIDLILFRGTLGRPTVAKAEILNPDRLSAWYIRSVAISDHSTPRASGVKWPDLSDVASLFAVRPHRAILD